MITIYTDASVRKGKAVASCFVISKDNFLGYRVFEYSNICTTLQCELFAVRDALNYVLHEVDDAGPILLYCDSIAAVEQLTGTAPTPLFKNVVNNILFLTRDVDIEFLHIQGHQTCRNANKIVDSISNYVLRFKYFRRKERA